MCESWGEATLLILLKKSQHKGMMGVTCLKGAPLSKVRGLPLPPHPHPWPCLGKERGGEGVCGGRVVSNLADPIDEELSNTWE